MMPHVVMLFECWKYLRGNANYHKPKLCKTVLVTGPCDYKCHKMAPVLFSQLPFEIGQFDSRITLLIPFRADQFKYMSHIESSTTSFIGSKLTINSSTPAARNLSNCTATLS